MPTCELNYYSNALQMATSANVILPDPSLKGPYEVMFLLHGLSDDHTIWSRRTSIERYVERLPLIVVMPNGGRGFYCDAIEGFAYGKAIGEELPALIKTYFQTKPNWSITGLSMGGYGAFRLALSYSETFRSAVSHSGALYFGHGPFFDPSDEFAKEFTRVLGEDPSNGPNDLFHLAKTCKSLPALRFDCGVDDFLLNSNRAFDEFLKAEGIPYEYQEFPGDHSWSYWDEHVQEAIAFHRKNLKF